MAVSQIPRRARAVIHDAVILFSICDEPGVLDSIQEPLAVVLGIGAMFAQEVGQDGRDFGFASG